MTSERDKSNLWDFLVAVRQALQATDRAAESGAGAGASARPHVSSCRAAAQVILHSELPLLLRHVSVNDIYERTILY